MTEHDTTKQVRRFYENVQFPGIRPLDMDGLILMRRIKEIASRHRKSKGSERLRVLDAGCGTGNTSIALARQFRDMDFVGVDISGPSLAVAEHLATEEELENLSFFKRDLMESRFDGGSYHIVLCLGVLHHTADMEKVLSNIASVLSKEGHLFLWIYSRHGRYRHSLNQRLLKMILDVDPVPEDPLPLAQEFATQFANSDSLNDLFSQGTSESLLDSVMNNPAWIADQYLHPREVLLNMEDLLFLVSSVGLNVRQLLGVPNNLVPFLGSGELARRFNKLADHQRLIALDLLLKPSRFFFHLEKPQIKHSAQ